jgi:hypothetical protein
MTPPAEKKPPENTAGSSHLQQFARDLGSTKGLDPIPPDQYLTYQNARYPDTVRLWAWMLGHTIRLGFRKAYACDKSGKALSLGAAAADLGCDNIHRVWRTLVTEGRVHKDGRRLCVNGDVTLPESPKSAKLTCTVDFSPSIPPPLRVCLSKLSPPDRAAILAQYADVDRAEQKCISEAIGAVRSIFRERKNKVLRDAGIEPANSKSNFNPERYRKFASVLEPLVATVHVDLATSVDETVQDTFSDCTEPKSASVQVENQAPSISSEKPSEIRTSEGTTTTGETTAPSAVVVVGAELRIHGPVVEPAVVKFVEACRKNCPHCTAEEIVQEIRTTARSFDRSIRSPFGVLKTSVPGTIAASIEKRRARLRSEAAAKLAEDQHTASIILENPHSYAAEDIAWARAVPMPEKAKGAGNA